MQMLSDCLLFGIYVAIGAPDHSAMKKMSGKPSYGLPQRSLGGRYMPISAQKWDFLFSTEIYIFWSNTDHNVNTNLENKFY